VGDPGTIIWILARSVCGDSDRGAHPGVDAALELVQARRKTGQLISRARGQGNRQGWTARGGLGQPDVEARDKPTPVAGDLRERVGSAAFVRHVHGLPLVNGQVRRLVAPRWVANQSPVRRNRQRRNKQRTELGKWDVSLMRL